LADCEVSFICVGTPSSSDGSLNTAAVESVCAEIGEALKKHPSDRPLTVAIRSTVMPGTARRCEERLAETARVCVNPEFLREGSAVSDFLSPPFTLVGTSDEEWAEPLRLVYGFLNAPFVVVDTGVAEILKTVSNTWHATKICFTNEVARLCQQLKIDPQAVMDLFVRDERLNLSASYLRPGFAYGGSCLPKDVEAINHLARQHHVELPLLEGVPRSNRRHLRKAMEAITSSGCQRVGFLGLSFKPGTDDLRGSPLVDLVEFCLGKGMTVRIFDKCVNPELLVGSNRRYVMERIGHIGELLASRPEDLVERSDLFVVGHRDDAFADFCRRLPAGKKILDLVRVVHPKEVAAGYVGVAW
jgi:GDP-mannose 6-dehydrogenase